MLHSWVENWEYQERRVQKDGLSVPIWGMINENIESWLYFPNSVTLKGVLGDIGMEKTSITIEIEEMLQYLDKYFVIPNEEKLRDSLANNPEIFKTLVLLGKYIKKRFKEILLEAQLTSFSSTKVKLSLVFEGCPVPEKELEKLKKSIYYSHLSKYLSLEAICVDLDLDITLKMPPIKKRTVKVRVTKRERSKAPIIYEEDYWAG